jgi:superfamily II DNA or RNA helicase
LDLSNIQSLAQSWQKNTRNLVHAKETISAAILQHVEEENENDINKGEYDCVVGVSSVINVIITSQPVPLSVIISEISPPDIKEREILIWIISRSIDELVKEGRLLYIYDRQRVRSRIAEMVRYFSYLKQRFEPDYSRSPGLAHMVKLSIKTRKHPKRAIPLDSGLRELASCKNEISLHPDIKPLLQERLNSSFKIFRKMVEYNFGTEDVLISQFQQDGLKELFKAAISSEFQSADRSYIIQSNTGSGKTEAFLFPILLYTLLNYDQKGTKALLLYPRIDLCNDQLQRLLRYVWIINSTNVLEGKKIRISLQHSGFDSLSISCPYPGCTGTIRFKDDQLSCDSDDLHIFDFVTKKNQGIADIIITTPDSLHRRLMDRDGKDNIWDSKRILPKFVVFDEAHIYSEQMGMHVANIVRRLRHKITVKGKSEPIFIASSATVGEPEKFAQSLFSTAMATVIRPKPDDMEDLGREYIIFIKATDPRKVLVSDPDENDRFTIATNLSAMIQTAFCFYHTMFKSEGKDRIIGFIDSIDIIKRLGDNLCNAERTRNLYRFRIPDQKLGTHGNSICPHVACQSLPPNPYMNRCQVYEDGECWWTMNDRDLDPMSIHLHKSKTSLDCDGRSVQDDSWDMMITTSALEVGFDHPAVIGTFQYMSPMNVPGFVQRIGRGGRSPSDMPVAIVVLGSRPLDSFYFHHHTLLTNPSEDKLIIPIDPENRHIMAMHFTSFLYDFISTYGTVQDVDACYKYLNTQETMKFITERMNQFVQAANESFGLSEKEIHEHLDIVISYLESCSEKLEPKRPDSSFIGNTRFIRDGKTLDEIIRYLSQAVARIEMEVSHDA